MRLVDRDGCVQTSHTLQESKSLSIQYSFAMLTRSDLAKTICYLFIDMRK